MQEMNSENSELENALKSLVPINAGIDPIAAAFAAGRNSAQRQIHLWQAAAMLLVLSVAASWILPVNRRAVPVPHGSNPAVAVAQPMPQLAPQSLFILNEIALKDGVDALPLESFPSVKSVRANDVY